MDEIIYIDRQTGQKKVERIYKEKGLRLLYGDSWLSSLVRPLLTQWPFFSLFYGCLQNQRSSARYIRPFIQKFSVDEKEFLEQVSSFRSFNDFFIRRLKPEARPLAPMADVAIIPADGRYYFYENLATCDGFLVKGQKFYLEELLQDSSLAEAYREGSMVLARLAPSDYHRFHFPCDCLPGETRLINGLLYSVNPLAVKKNIHILSQNKRTLCELETPAFGRILDLEIGATSVGSIKQTYQPHHWQRKGDEKGYFEFGGSALILLFPPRAILFDADLLSATKQGLEIRCLMGQSMGRSPYASSEDLKVVCEAKNCLSPS